MVFNAASFLSVKSSVRIARNIGATLAALVTLQGCAIAQESGSVEEATLPPCEDPLPAGWLSRPIMSPAPDDRQAIVDLISSYNWALDNKDPTAFRELFTQNVTYEVCKAEGREQIVKKTDRDAVVVHVQSLMSFLIRRTLRTRHFVSNTIIDATPGQPVRGKSSMLVLLHNGYSLEPEFDYSATLKAEFTKGTDNVWRFSKLTLLTDSNAISPDGVRAR